jgi:hypothetical protein
LAFTRTRRIKMEGMLIPGIMVFAAVCGFIVMARMSSGK